MIYFLSAIYTTFLTIISELFITSFVFKYRKREVIFSVILVNLISHPIFQFFLWTNSLVGFFELKRLSFGIILIEIFIVFFESFLLFFALKQNYWQWLNLSFWMNLFSFVLGLLIFWK